MYEHKFSSFLESELDKLCEGSEKEKQRYRNAMNAVARVMSNPIDRQFSKDLPDNYKAVDVLQQIRLFFKINNSLTETDPAIVFFCWINNDEDSIHRSGEKGDAYEVFRNLLAKGEIEVYKPDEPSTEKFTQHDDWGKNTVYFSFSRQKAKDLQMASSHLQLSQIYPNDYRIDSVTVTDEDQGLAKGLLEGLCRSADDKSVCLNYELTPSSLNYGKTRHLLEKFKFTYLETIDGLELWTRNCPKK